MELRQITSEAGTPECVVNTKPYLDAAAQAILDVVKALTDGDARGPDYGPSPVSAHPAYNHHAAYRMFVSPNRPDAILEQPAGTRVQNLIRRICGNIGYKVDFMPGGLPADVPQGFVSWIQVNFEECKFIIWHEMSHIREVFENAWDQQNALAKVLLHECAHAVLHRGLVEALVNEQNTDKPCLPEAREQDAWLYALVVWGILVGDHAFFTRTDKKHRRDCGWMLA